MALNAVHAITIESINVKFALASTHQELQSARDPSRTRAKASGTGATAGEESDYLVTLCRGLPTNRRKMGVAERAPAKFWLVVTLPRWLQRPTF